MAYLRGFLVPAGGTPSPTLRSGCRGTNVMGYLGNIGGIAAEAGDSGTAPVEEEEGGEEEGGGGGESPLVGFKITNVTNDFGTDGAGEFQVSNVDEPLEVGDLIIVISATVGYGDGFGSFLSNWTHALASVSENGSFDENVTGIYRYADGDVVAAESFTFTRSVAFFDVFSSPFIVLAFRGINQTSPWGSGVRGAAVLAEGVDAVAPGTPAATGALGATVLRGFVSSTGTYSPEDATLITRATHVSNITLMSESIEGAESPLSEETATLFSGVDGTKYTFSIPLEPAA